MNKDFLLEFYRMHIENELIPFWSSALDHQYGGVFTCFNNDGGSLISKNKYTWSQGRFLWVWSKIVRQISENKLNGNIEPFMAHLNKTVVFLEKNAFLENGNCAYLLSDSGEKLKSKPGDGFDISFYSDCFIVLGLAEYAGLSKDIKRFEFSLEVYLRIVERLKSENIRSEPYPIPLGYKAHAVSMIMLNVAQQMADIAKELNHKKQQELFQNSIEYMLDIMNNFCLPDHRIIEMLPEDRSGRQTILYRHINPGHTFESMWFVIHTALKIKKFDLVEKAIKLIEKTFLVGWDHEYGGIFHFVDEQKGCPKGRLKNLSFETLILNTWDTKLWWVHSEALYAIMLAYTLTGSEPLKMMHEKLHNYVFNTFPNPDIKIKEWIQIRDRKGNPIDKIVALPVKDPFHILRNLLLMIDLLEIEIKKGGTKKLLKLFSK